MEKLIQELEPLKTTTQEAHIQHDEFVEFGLGVRTQRGLVSALELAVKLLKDKCKDQTEVEYFEGIIYKRLHSFDAHKKVAV